MVLAPTGGSRFYGWSDLRHNIGQYLPSRASHPLDYFRPDEVSDIHRRLHELEYQVAYTQKTPDFSKSINRIEAMLPEFISTKRDSFGDVQIPDGFWHALQDRIRADRTLVSNQIDDSTKSSAPSNGLSLKDVRNEIGKEYGKLWDRWVKANNAKLDSMSEDVAGRFPQMLKENRVATKAEIIELIRQNWEDNKESIRIEIHQLAKKLEETTDRLAKLSQSTSGMSKTEANSVVKDIISKLVPDLQLDAQSKANIKSDNNLGLDRVNFFSKATGAVINPHVTSPNYVFPSQDAWFPTRWVHYAMGNQIPLPNPPESALTKWEEHGDCWCSPATDSEGFGPSIGVITGRTIYPEQIIVEHIKPIASLEPGAAPREMELLALIGDFDTYNSVKSMSEEVFNDDAGELQKTFGSDRVKIWTDNYVRIASWTYDAESSFNIQAFPINIDIKSLGGHSNKFVVRSKSNWGNPTVDYTCLYRIRLLGEIVPES